MRKERKVREGKEHPERTGFAVILIRLKTLGLCLMYIFLKYLE